MRTFETGATRDVDNAKLDYEAFLSPIVLRAYAEYMNHNRVQADGAVRPGDNWQLGIPLDAYMKSAWRHFMALWQRHRGNSADEEIETACCAVLFNIQGYLHEYIKHRHNTDLSVVQAVKDADDALAIPRRPNCPND